MSVLVETTESNFITAKQLWCSDRGKKLSIETRFDGHGNAVVRFIVEHEGRRISFEKYDAAVNRYNMIRN